MARASQAETLLRGWRPDSLQTPLGVGGCLGGINAFVLVCLVCDGGRTLKHENNPWSLSAAEVRAIEAVIDTGCIKLGSKKLGVTDGVLENRTANARKKMNARFALTSYLMWDRYRMEASDGKLPELQHGPRQS